MHSLWHWCFPSSRVASHYRFQDATLILHVVIVSLRSNIEQFFQPPQVPLNLHRDNGLSTDAPAGSPQSSFFFFSSSESFDGIPAQTSRSPSVSSHQHYSTSASSTDTQQPVDDSAAAENRDSNPLQHRRRRQAPTRRRSVISSLYRLITKPRDRWSVTITPAESAVQEAGEEEEKYLLFVQRHWVAISQVLQDTPELVSSSGDGVYID